MVLNSLCRRLHLKIMLALVLFVPSLAPAAVVQGKRPDIESTLTENVQFSRPDSQPAAAQAVPSADAATRRANRRQQRALNLPVRYSTVAPA